MVALPRALLGIVLVLLVAMPSQGGTQSTTGNATASGGPRAQLLDWMHDLQYGPGTGDAEGAVRVSHGIAFGAEPVAYHRVVPYFSNLGVTQLLQSSDPDARAMAEGYIAWYADHALAQDSGRRKAGMIVDHWYRPTGGDPVTCFTLDLPAWELRMYGYQAAQYCDHADADDSYAATFLLMAGTYWDVTGDASAEAFLLAHETQIERVAAALDWLVDSDGLTWATADKVVKYTMDNAETVAGFRAIALLEDEVFGSPSLATYYDARADDAADALSDLRDATRYKVAKHKFGSEDAADISRWYPGTVAQVWPHLFGVTSGSSAQATQAMADLDTWDGNAKQDWVLDLPDGVDQPWASLSWAAHLAGSSADAALHTEYLLCRVTPAPGKTWQTDAGSYKWPFTVMDGGFLARSVDEGHTLGPGTMACPNGEQGTWTPA